MKMKFFIHFIILLAQREPIKRDIVTDINTSVLLLFVHIKVYISYQMFGVSSSFLHPVCFKRTK